MMNYDKFLRKKLGQQVNEKFKNVFDITNVKGLWLSAEDRKLYEIQLSSDGKIGYASSNFVNLHPEKKWKLN